MFLAKFGVSDSEFQLKSHRPRRVTGLTCHSGAQRSGAIESQRGDPIGRYAPSRMTGDLLQQDSLAAFFGKRGPKKANKERAECAHAARRPLLKKRSKTF